MIRQGGKGVAKCQKLPFCSVKMLIRDNKQGGKGVAQMIRLDTTRGGVRISISLIRDKDMLPKGSFQFQVLILINEQCSLSPPPLYVRQNDS